MSDGLLMLDIDDFIYSIDELLHTDARNGYDCGSIGHVILVSPDDKKAFIKSLTKLFEESLHESLIEYEDENF